MNRRAALSSLALTACLAAGGLWTAARPTPARPRNVLLVSIDLLRADHVWPDGPASLAPTLRRLASEGLCCTRARAHCPLTRGAAKSLLSGRWLSDWTADAPSIGSLLAFQGWRTGAFLSSFELHAKTGHLPFGFDTYDCPSAHDPEVWRDAAATNEKSLAWLSRQAPDSPVFCWVMYWGLHHTDLCTGRVAAAGEQRPANDVNRAYCETLTYEDRCLAELLEGWRRLGRLDDTVVVVSGLHGTELGAQDSMRQRVALTENLLRVPLVFWRPGTITAGSVADVNVGHVDVLPTVLGMVGVPSPVVKGTDLRGPDAGTERDFIGECLDGEGRTIVRKRWKYVEYTKNLDKPRVAADASMPDDPARPGWIVVRPRGTRELYDLRADPGEQANLLASRPDLTAELHAALQALPPPATTRRSAPDPELEKALRDHGYLPR